MAIIEGLGSERDVTHLDVETDGLVAGGGARLRRRLVAVDVSAAALAWSVGLLLATSRDDDAATVALVFAAVLGATLVGLRQQQLYRSRVAATRSEEVARLAKVAVLSGLVVLAAGRLLDATFTTRYVVLGTVLCFALLAYGRGRYQAWLRAERSAGNFARRVVVVGQPAEVASMVELFEESPELGIRPVGFVGPIDLDGPVPAVPCLGGLGDVRHAVRARAASGVVICAGSLGPDELKRLVHDLHEAGVHVHVSSGISGVHHRRLHVQPVGYEPFIYVEPARLSRAQLVAKRVLDVVVASVALLVLSPVMLVAAAAVRLSDGGPALFRQQRVGRDGVPFTILKLRTMCTDAEARLAEVRNRNERQGPLFKASDDPRVTRVGRFLRTTSVDELPQLLNVLHGTMSLVGPRPALPSEVATFDGDLTGRFAVKPGITGLWQVEARDKPSFGAYRRLDLFYVENWSVWLDLAILLRTGPAVLRRARRAIVGRGGAAAHTAAAERRDGLGDLDPVVAVAHVEHAGLTE